MATTHFTLVDLGRYGTGVGFDGESYLEVFNRIGEPWRLAAMAAAIITEVRDLHGTILSLKDRESEKRKLPSHEYGLLELPADLGLGQHHFPAWADLRDADQAIQDLGGASTRARKAIRQRGIRTVREFMSLTPDDFLAIKNCGPTTVAELLNLQKKLRFEPMCTNGGGS